MRNRVGSPSALKMVASARGDRSEDPPTMGKVVTWGRISQHIENYRYDWKTPRVSNFTRLFG